MADAEPTNITQLRPPDPTNAERQRRHRAKRKPRKRATVTRAVTPTVTVPVTPTVTVDQRGSVTVRAATLAAALALATCSAAFSISGLTSIFAGAFWAVIGLGCAFEVGKLSTVAWLGNATSHVGRKMLRAALVALVAVLMVLNSIGVYGFLSRAHIEHALAGDVKVSVAASNIDARLDAKQADLDDIKSRIAQLDQTKTVAAKGHVRTSTVGADGPARAGLVHDIEKAKVDGERKAVEADLGPVRYLATLLGSTDEQTMRWFILIVALLLDPAAVLLLLAATHRGRR